MVNSMASIQLRQSLHINKIKQGIPAQVSCSLHFFIAFIIRFSDMEWLFKFVKWVNISIWFILNGYKRFTNCLNLNIPHWKASSDTHDMATSPGDRNIVIPHKLFLFLLLHCNLNLYYLNISNMINFFLLVVKS